MNRHIPVTFVCVFVCVKGGVTAPNKYHMPKQLAPPRQMVEPEQKCSGCARRQRVDAYRRRAQNLPAAQTPAQKRTYTKARSLNLCHHRSERA